MSQCRIHLENYAGIYPPGSVIRGRLECYFSEDTKIRGIKVRLICNEHNEWTGTETYRDPVDNESKTRHITLTGDHNILYIEQMLFGSESGTRVVNRGSYTYPFTYTLPYDIPSSFNGPHGSVTYTMKAVVDVPMWSDYTDSLNFLVKSPIDFNKKDKHLQEPSNYSDEKTVCCWCCRGGEITMDVEIPKLAFVRGEVMNLKVAVTNLSNSNVQDLKVKLTKTIAYRVTSPNHETKHDIENIASLTEHGVGAHGEHTYNLQLAIPQHVDVPNFTGCTLFDVSYLLEVTCAMPACTLDLDVSVGSIKLGDIQYSAHLANGGNEGHTITPGFINNLPPIDGAYPPSAPQNNYPQFGGYPPPAGGVYPPPAYPPPAGGTYPPPAGGAYPPPAGGAYPGGVYPPQAGDSYSQPPVGVYPPPYPSAFPEKQVYPPGPPTAPNPNANAPPAENPKAREAAAYGPSAPYGQGAELAPPSYDQIQQNANPPQ